MIIHFERKKRKMKKTLIFIGVFYGNVTGVGEAVEPLRTYYRTYYRDNKADYAKFAATVLSFVLSWLR